MKAITEAMVRSELKNVFPECYYVPEGMIVTPAAQEYLRFNKVKIEKTRTAQSEGQPAPRHADKNSGAIYGEKPEDMTHLSGNRLVPKNHPRIFLRGKMDSLNALIVLTQSEIASKAGNDKLVKDLDDIFAHVCMLMRCEVMDENVPEYKLLGLNDSEIRDRSHHPAKYYGVKQMTLPNKSHDIAYLRLNVIRTAVREAELAAAAAFALNATFNCSDGCGSSIIQSLNRLSSCIHIMMCMFLCGMYQ